MGIYTRDNQIERNKRQAADPRGIHTIKSKNNIFQKKNNKKNEKKRERNNQNIFNKTIKKNPTIKGRRRRRRRRERERKRKKTALKSLPNDQRKTIKEKCSNWQQRRQETAIKKNPHQSRRVKFNGQYKEKCLENVSKMSRKCLENVSKMSRK